ncbi:MAG: hypothetical protein ACJAWA_001121 [Nonlabens sp.]|jgi:hypothetical protein
MVKHAVPITKAQHSERSILTNLSPFYNKVRLPK